ncbi:hypothetical protein AIGOOFII_3379 [Methylobacterium marchantiae]|nr:hypothetical protein AIGOOFII_3379 [Methylobacterium marchantiae]
MAFPLFTLLMLVLEVGLTYWIGATLDRGVQGATRVFYAEGDPSQSGSISDAVRKIICDGSAGLINCDKLKIDLVYYAGLSDVVIRSPVDPSQQDWRSGFGDSHGCTSTSQFVVIQAAVAQRNFHSFTSGSTEFKDGSRLIQAAKVLRIEPKSAGLQGC